MKAKKLLSLLLTFALVLSLLPAVLVSSDGSGSGDFDAELDLAAALDDGTYKWEAKDGYYQLAYVTYVANPVYAEASKEADLKYQQITIFVPAAYVYGINPDGTLDINYDARIANGDGSEAYSAWDAPIYFACESPGYSENACSDTLGGMSDNTEFLNAGMVVVNVGHRGKGTSIQQGGETVYTGKAPWSLVDSKAAIQYLRLNDALIPGSAERIVSSASSGGGALSGMIGATGDYEEYLPYLYEIGAAGVAKAGGQYVQTLSNAVYASNLWCPILNVDYSDAAYEAFYGSETRSGHDNSFQVTLSAALTESFDAYIQALGFEGAADYEQFLNGPFKAAVEDSANEYLYSLTNGYLNVTWLEADDATPVTGSLTAAEKAAKFLAGNCIVESAGMGGQVSKTNRAPITWLSYADGVLTVNDMDACVAGLNTGNKAITGFDGILANMTENQPFGDKENNYKHYSTSYLALIQGNEALEEAFNGYDYAYTLSVKTEDVPADLCEGAEKRTTTTTYSVSVDDAGIITVDKTVVVADVKAASGGMPGMPGGPGGSSETVVKEISSETEKGYFVSGSAEEHKAEVEAAGVVIGQTAGQYATGFDSYEAWVADFAADVASQVDADTGSNVVDLYNPMNFILGRDQGGSGDSAYEGATLAKHWRVRHGTTDANSAPVIATLLNLALEEALDEGRIQSLDFILPWEGPHGTVECASDDLAGWIADVWEPVELTQAEIEYTLNLDNMDQEWTCSGGGWVLSVVPAVARPVLADYEGVSICVPGAYVKGIDTDGDGQVDVDATMDEAYAGVKGSLVIDYEGQVTSSNGVTYTAATAPLVLNTGAAGYGDQANQTAGTGYVSEGYINIACGNRGKQSSVTDSEGNVLLYTGDAPSCLVDQKAAARFVKYNILLGNLPGNVDLLVSTGGSGGAAHATMFAATSNNEAFYDYQIEVGAVGVYRLEDGSYSTTVTIDGKEVAISDGAWGSIAYSTISSLYEADMAQAFEYYIDETYEFSSAYEAKLAEYLAEAYMNYINEQKLTVDGKLLTIEYDPDKYPDTNGYGGSYLDYYLAEFTENLQWYADNAIYGSDWTWFNADGSPAEDLTDFDYATAYVYGRYAEGSESAAKKVAASDLPAWAEPIIEELKADAVADSVDTGSVASYVKTWLAAKGIDAEAKDSRELAAVITAVQDEIGGGSDSGFGMGGPGFGMGGPPDGMMPPGMGGPGMGSSGPSYACYADMVESWVSDVEAVYAGDRFGKNQVELYNPLNYIGAETTEDPTWAKIIMGAVEGDISMFCSMNIQIAWLNAGTDAEIEWQWGGGHVPSEIFGDSFALYVDQMYTEYILGSDKQPSKDSTCAKQTVNGSAPEATGTDLNALYGFTVEDGKVVMGLAGTVSYRNTGASKSVPGFDQEALGQECYVFGSETVDSRHFNKFIAQVLAEHYDELQPLYNATVGNPYNDVSETDWFYEDVIYDFLYGLMNGTGGGKFSPDATATRAMVVTVLYRLAGSPEVSGSNRFTDLTQDWYKDAVQWAVENGITDGESETRFDPDAPATREMLATFLYRYVKAEPVQADLSGYSDAEQISDWAADAMAWANAQGIITGVTETTLVPDGASSRAVLATVLARLDRSDF
ncbi:MAG: S-layer homology domain-containing protein [Oscillospiraceae bacterium]